MTFTNLSIVLCPTYLTRKILSLTTLILLFKDLQSIPINQQQVDETYYLNPWKKIRPIPKVIGFDEQGNFIEKNVIKKNFLNLSRIIDYYKPYDVEGFQGNNTTHKNVTFKEDVNEPKQKIYYVCKDTKCKFLVCEDIKSHCNVCVVDMKTDNAKPTICNKIDTHFFFLQRIIQSYPLPVKENEQ